MARRRPAQRSTERSTPRYGFRTADDAFMKKAHDRWKQGQKANDNQNERELADIKFYNGDQWPDDIKTIRAGQNASNGLPPAPARPCLTIDQTRPAVNVYINQIRNSDIGVELVPADDFGDRPDPVNKREIELREGLVRRIQREPETEDASLWGASRGIIAGRGYWLVMTRYANNNAKAQANESLRDQEIYVERIFNQASVVLDPAHEQPDGSDAEWGFVGTDMPWDQYQAEFPKIAGGQNNDLSADVSNDEFRALGDEHPGWFTAEGETRSCRVVDYYYTERTSRDLLQRADGSLIWKDELPSEEKAAFVRTVVAKTIKWAKIDGIQKLDETDWPGKYLPIVKYLANELHADGDDEKKVEGAVRPMRDPAMGLNFMVSKQVEVVGLSPIPPWQVAEGTIETYEEWYKAANTRTLPYLPYKQTDLEGRTAPPPSRTQINTGISDIANSVMLFKEAISDTSGVHAPTQGDTDPALRSSKAIRLTIDQDRQSTTQYVDNYAKSKRHEGRIINDLLYPIYGTRPGRLARIVNGEGQASTVHMASPAGTGMDSNTADQYILTPDAEFNVVVKVTKAFETRREQETTVIGQLLQAEPQLITWFGDLFFKNQDGPGHEEMAERAKLMLAPPIQQAMAQKQAAQPLPPMAQAHIQQLQQELEKAQTAAKGMAQALETKQIEAQRDLERDKLKADNALQLKQMEIDDHERDRAAKIEIARISAAKQAADPAAEGREEAIALQHEAQQSALDRLHEVGMTGMEQAHERELAQHDASVQAQLADQGHAQALEQGAQSAALQPPAAGV